MIPKYLLGTSRLPFSSIVEQLGLPFVGKGLESSMGEEIVCIRDKASYEELSLNYPSSKEWLFEEFISESYGEICAFTASAEKPLPVCSAHPRGISVQM